MPNQRTTTGRGSSSLGSDVTRDSMLRDDETTGSTQGRIRDTNAEPPRKP